MPPRPPSPEDLDPVLVWALIRALAVALVVVVALAVAAGALRP